MSRLNLKESHAIGISSSTREGRRGLQFNNPVLQEPRPDGQGVTASENGDVTLYFGNPVGSGVMDVAFDADGDDLQFMGFTAGPLKQDPGVASRVWLVNETGSIANTPFEVVEITRNRIQIRSTYQRNESFSYALLYQSGGVTYLCDPEITNDGDSWPCPDGRPEPRAGSRSSNSLWSRVALAFRRLLGGRPR